MKSRNAIFWLVIALVFAGYGAWQALNGHYLLADSEEYLQEARNIREQGVFYCGDLSEPVRMDYYTKRPPLYPLLLAVLGLGGNPVPVLLVLQNLLALGNLWLAWRLLLLLGFPEKRRWWLLPFILIYPAQFIYANFVMTEILLQSLLLALVWEWLHFFRDGKQKRLLRYQLWLLLAVLLKPVVYPLVLLNLGWMPLMLWRHPLRWRLLPLALIPLAGVLGYSAWNAQRTGVFHYSSIQQINLLQYNTYYTLVATEGPGTATRMVDSIAYRADALSDYGERQAFIRKSCLSLLAPRIPTYTALHLRGMLNFFIDPGRFDLSSFLGLENREGKGKGFLYYYSKEGYKGVFSFLATQSLPFLLILMLTALLNLLKVLGAIRFTFLRHIPWQQRLLLLGLVLYLAALTGPLGASRFALPVFPMLLIMLGMGGRVWSSEFEV